MTESEIKTSEHLSIAKMNERHKLAYRGDADTSVTDAAVSRPSILQRLTDYFVGVHFQRESDEYHQAKIFVGVLLANTLLLVAASFYFAFIAPVETISIVVAIGMMGVLFTGYMFSLNMLRNTGNYLLSANLAVLFTHGLVVLGVFLSGGPSSAVNQVVLTTPIMAFCLAGRNSGFYWTLGVLFTEVLLEYFESMGYTFPQSVISIGTTHEESWFFWFITFGCIVGALTIYESINQRLKEERDKEHDQYVFLATHDPLTFLPNRAMFDTKMKEAVARADRTLKPFALLYIDLDGFKDINDTYGHKAGDHVLNIVAERLNTAVRKTDTVARLGGDEFAIILENFSRSEYVNQVSASVLHTLAKPVKLDDNSVSVTGSIGIAFYPDHSQNEDELRSFADSAMYSAKKVKNRYFVYRNAESVPVTEA